MMSFIELAEFSKKIDKNAADSNHTITYYEKSVLMNLTVIYEVLKDIYYELKEQ